MQFPDKRDLDYRYAYQGQEKDDETGMEAFELRLWDSRIGRWLTPDPAGQYYSPYLGMGNNPISRIDPDGGEDGVFEVGEDGSVTKISNAGDDIGQDTYIYSDGSGFVSHEDGSFTDFAASASMSNPSMAQQWSKGNLAQQMAYGTLNSFYTTAQWAMLKQPLDQLNNDGFENAMLNLDGSYTTTNDAAMNWSGSFMTMLGGGSFGGKSLVKSGPTFQQYKNSYWTLKSKPSLEPLINRGTGQIWKQYSELHHLYIPQRAKWAPNWLKNNSINLKEATSLEHAMMDPYRARFAPKWVKEVYNLKWK